MFPLVRPDPHDVAAGDALPGLPERAFDGLPGANLFQTPAWGRVRAQHGWRSHLLAGARAGTVVLSRRVPGAGMNLYSIAWPRRVRAALSRGG